jgi:ceramide glucosyltransferase
MSPSLLLLGALAALSLALTLTCTGVALHAVRRARRRPAPDAAAAPAPPISVLKPLKGADPDLYDNLAAFAGQDYPRFELLLGTADPDDPALEIAQRIASDFPGVAIRVVTGAPDLGLNPKVANLAHLSRYARHDWVLVSDADVRPGPGYLRRLADELADPRVALVSSMLAGVGEESVGAALENLHLGSFVAATVCSVQRLAGLPCVVGKSMLLRRSELERLGGWRSVRDVLAEDYVLGRAFHRAGRRVALCADPLPVINRSRTIHAFLSRHLRWAQMRCRIAPWAYGAELLLAPAPWALAFAAAAARDGAGPAGLGLAVAAIALQVTAQAALLRSLRGPVRLPLRRLPWLPIKDLLVLALWPLGILKRRVWWRGTPLTIGRGSALRPAVAPRTETPHAPFGEPREAT